MAERGCIEQKNADKLRPGGNFVLLNSLLAFQPFSAACSPPDGAVFMPHSSLHPQHLSLPSHHSGCLNQMPGARYFRLIYQQFVYLKISNMRCASSSRCPMPCCRAGLEVKAAWAWPWPCHLGVFANMPQIFKQLATL